LEPGATTVPTTSGRASDKACRARAADFGDARRRGVARITSIASANRRLPSSSSSPHQGREEDEAAGDVLGLLGQVLADKCVVEAELVGEDHGLPILLQGLRRRAVDRVQGHGEVTEAHAPVYKMTQGHNV